MVEPKLQFTAFHVLRVALEREKLLSQGTFQIDFNEVSQKHETDNDKFRSLFVVSLKCPEDPTFSLIVQAAGDFVILGNPSEEVLSNFRDVSAPSIVYPYIRAFVSSIMTQSGMLPVYLPPINFASIKRKNLQATSPSSENPPAG